MGCRTFLLLGNSPHEYTSPQTGWGKEPLDLAGRGWEGEGPREYGEGFLGFYFQIVASWD